MARKPLTDKQKITQYESKDNSHRYMEEIIKAKKLDDILVVIGNQVYKDTYFLEDLEFAKLIHGNGHHMRQHIVQIVQDLILERWNNDEESNKSKSGSRSGKVI